MTNFDFDPPGNGNGDESQSNGVDSHESGSDNAFLHDEDDDSLASLVGGLEDGRQHPAGDDDEDQDLGGEGAGAAQPENILAQLSDDEAGDGGSDGGDDDNGSDEGNVGDDADEFLPGELKNLVR
jgi:hypothetical protein